MKERTLDSVLLFCLAMMLSVGAESRREAATKAQIFRTGELQYEKPTYLTGVIYESDTKHLLFKFKRVASRSGSTLSVHRDYTYPDGTPAARERVIYEGNDLVLYELKELQIGAEGSASIRRAPGTPTQGSIEFEYTKGIGGRKKKRTEPLKEDTLINDMVGPFLQSHWGALLAGEELKCRYIVVPRRETVGFTFVKDRESTLQGRKVIIVKMGATSPFIAQLVAPLFFTIALAPPHHVLQYTGRTTPKMQAGANWKDLDAVSVFDWESAR